MISKVSRARLCRAGVLSNHNIQSSVMESIRLHIGKSVREKDDMRRRLRLNAAMHLFYVVR
jgi:hypothetical protein